MFDRNTHRVAWHVLEPVLDGAGIRHVTHILPDAHVEPDEYTMGSLCMAFNRSCDAVVAVGSGVINDCCKVLAHVAGVPSLVLPTAPSMARLCVQLLCQRFVRNFSPLEWERQTRAIFGKAADTIIEKEKTTYHKNDPALHAQRVDRIVTHWDEIQQIIEEELPAVDDVLGLMRGLSISL